jgi:hypothetical protein
MIKLGLGSGVRRLDLESRCLYRDVWDDKVDAHGFNQRFHHLADTEQRQNHKKLDRAAPADVMGRLRPVQLEIHAQSFFSTSSSILYA